MPERPNNEANDADIADTDNESDRLAAYDLDGDGEISAVEEARGTLGLVDARLEQIAEESGPVKGALADAAHRVIDQLDND